MSAVPHGGGTDTFKDHFKFNLFDTLERVLTDANKLGVVRNTESIGSLLWIKMASRIRRGDGLAGTIVDPQRLQRSNHSTSVDIVISVTSTVQIKVAHQLMDISIFQKSTGVVICSTLEDIATWIA